MIPRALLLLAALTAATTLACSKSVATADVGECFERPEDLGSIEDFDTVDCDEAHFGEVYETFDVEGDDFPGDEAIAQQSEERCLAAYETYVGIPYEESAFGYFSIKPSEESWNEADDREVICVLTALDGESELTGSKKGSNE
jgi:Septum formation